MSADNGSDSRPPPPPLHLHVSKTPVSYFVDDALLDDGRKCVRLRFEGPNGSNVYLLMPVFAKRIADDLIAHSGGIVVPGVG